MNWDWDKLSEQKRRQGSPIPDPGRLGEDLADRLSDMKKRLPGGPKLLIGVLALLWAASGIYIVEPDEACDTVAVGSVIERTSSLSVET